MSQKLTFFPIGNAETCLLELGSGKKILFDYAAMYDGSSSDNRYDIKTALSNISEYEIVMFSHAHDDHTKGASEYFFLDHAEKYQSSGRAVIKELWVSAAFLLDTDLENHSDAKIIRAEARYRLKNGYGIKVFAEPDTLSEWLKSQEISAESVSHLIIHAGNTIDLPDKLANEMQVFVHAPFSADSDEVQNKNDPSIVLQVRLFNDDCSTNILITGDAPYEVLDKIVDLSEYYGNEAYLSWDIYDIPHHCSYTGLGEKSSDTIMTPSENVQRLLSQSAPNAYMVASCKKITAETSPPHLNAKKAYEHYTDEDVTFIATMEHIPASGKKPTPVIFEINSMGLTLKRDNSQDVYFHKTAPRAG